MLGAEEVVVASAGEDVGAFGGPGAGAGLAALGDDCFFAPLAEVFAGAAVARAFLLGVGGVVAVVGVADGEEHGVSGVGARAGFVGEEGWGGGMRKLSGKCFA